MTKFIASNGMQFKVRDGGMFASRASADELWGVGWSANSDFMNGLREYFQHGRDTELGRWRWPENPDYVVYLNDGDHGKTYLSMCESTGESTDFLREESARLSLKAHGRDSWDGVKAINAYLDAHPESKPWHDAKPGEAWMLTFTNGDSMIGLVDKLGECFIGSGQELTTLNSRAFQAGHRIWPEEAR